MIEERESVIIVPVPAAESVIGKWRNKYDLIASHGMGAHITTLFPFKNSKQIDEKVLNKMKNFFSNVHTFEFSMTKINTFPEVIYLEPEPKEKFIELTKGIINIFPENPWFEGKFAEIIPHLTIGNKLQNPELVKNEIIIDISPKLPIKTFATETWLMEKKNGNWLMREKFPFKK